MLRLPLHSKALNQSLPLLVFRFFPAQNMQLTSCCCLLLQLQAALGQRDKHITSLQEALAAKSDEVSSSMRLWQSSLH
jgi:hypothetical protein